MSNKHNTNEKKVRTEKEENKNPNDNQLQNQRVVDVYFFYTVNAVGIIITA